ncbi:MAG: SusC/RagA family TonB-linked outer membrane protein [Bacteroidia bacterium]
MKQLVQSFLLIFVLIFATSQVLGQRVISGKITASDTGEPLIGVTVLVSGTTTGARSDDNGDYKVQVPAGSQSLKFSYIGYTSLELPVGDSDVMDVRMQSEVLSTDEVLIIGYGTIKKEDATGSIQSVSSEVFNKGAITSPQELLAGKVAGVQITTGGDPGAGATIRIRGGSSLSASNDPLIVIDGVPVFNDGISGSRNPLNLLNPNDIETFTVLKDASATAIYGSRASNGVILITTKKGKLGKKISVNYAGQFSVGTITRTLDVLNGDEYRALMAERYDENHPARALVGNENTDWQSQIYQAALGTDHNVSVSGGIGEIPYRVSLGYTNKNGVLKTDNFNRTTAAVNLSPGFLNNTLQINANFKGMLSNNRFGNRGAIGSAAFFDPTQPIYQDGNKFDGYFTWTQPNGDPIPIAPANPLALLNMRDDRSQVSRYLTNIQADYRMPFLPELRANLNLGYDRSAGSGTVDVPANAPFAYSDGGEDREYSQLQTNFCLIFISTTKKKQSKP